MEPEDDEQVRETPIHNGVEDIPQEPVLKLIWVVVHESGFPLSEGFHRQINQPLQGDEHSEQRKISQDSQEESHERKLDEGLQEFSIEGDRIHEVEEGQNELQHIDVLTLLVHVQRVEDNQLEAESHQCNEGKEGKSLEKEEDQEEMPEVLDCLEVSELDEIDDQHVDEDHCQEYGNSEV